MWLQILLFFVVNLTPTGYNRGFSDVLRKLIDYKVSKRISKQSSHHKIITHAELNNVILARLNNMLPY